MVVVLDFLRLHKSIRSSSSPFWMKIRTLIYQLYLLYAENLNENIYLFASNWKYRSGICFYISNLSGYSKKNYWPAGSVGGYESDSVLTSLLKLREARVHDSTTFHSRNRSNTNSKARLGKIRIVSQ